MNEIIGHFRIVRRIREMDYENLAHNGQLNSYLFEGD